MEKQRHNLFGVKTTAQFVSELRALGIEVDELIGGITRPGANIGVVVVGSITKGFAKPQSDIDLLILCESKSDLLADSASHLISAGDEGRIAIHKKFAAGIEFDIEVVSYDSLANLRHSVEALLSVFAGNVEGNGIPELSYDDLRFLNMLRTCWTIRGGEIVDKFKTEFRSDLLSVYFAIYYCIQYFEYLEDAISYKDESEEVFCTAVRLCAQCACLSLIGLMGFTDPNVKWLWKYIHTGILNQPSANVDSIVSLLRRLFFIGLSSTSHDRDKTIAELRSVKDGLDKFFAKDPRLSALLKQVLTQFKYILD
jgi:predicted nucleotidyltransferase